MFGMTDGERRNAALNLVCIEGLIATIQCVVAMTPDGTAWNWLAGMFIWILAAIGYVVLTPNG